MSAGAKFILAIGLIHVIGFAVLAASGKKTSGLVPLFGSSGAVGLVTVILEMLAFSLAGIPWSIPALCAMPFLAGAIGLIVRRGVSSGHSASRPSPAAVVTAVFLLLATYAAATTRATALDLVLFWGAKGERFAIARSIDVAFLSRPENYLMHSDYPPGLPFLFAFGSLVAGRFPWGASLLVMPWLLAATVSLFAASARKRIGNPEGAGWLTAVCGGVLAFSYLVTLSAGNADSLLILFEVAAFTALACARGHARGEWLAGFALAGAVLAKIEGVFFAAIFTSCIAIIERSGFRDRVQTALRLSAVPASVFIAWMIFCRTHGLLNIYRGGMGQFTLMHAAKIPSAVLQSASYGYGYLPWLAIGAAAFAVRRFGFARAPLVMAVLFLGVNIFFYLHGERDPTEWIGWSAGRTLITMMTCFLFSLGAGNLSGSRAAPQAPTL
jgi:hypothetical protein